MGGSSETGRKDDEGKLDYSLLPFEAIDEIVAVLGFGANKYGRHNWREVPDSRHRYLAAALRHLSQYAQGNSHDEESSLSHLAHAACCLIFLIAVTIDD